MCTGAPVAPAGRASAPRSPGSRCGPGLHCQAVIPMVCATGTAVPCSRLIWQRAQSPRRRKHERRSSRRFASLERKVSARGAREPPPAGGHHPPAPGRAGKPIARALLVTHLERPAVAWPLIGIHARGHASYPNTQPEPAARKQWQRSPVGDHQPRGIGDTWASTCSVSRYTGLSISCSADGRVQRASLVK